MRTLLILVFVLVLVMSAVGCTGRIAAPAATSTPVTAQSAPTSTAALSDNRTLLTSTPVVTRPVPTPCALSPIVVPTRPARTPGYTELDEATGLHVTGTAPNIDLASYRLRVAGKVEQPLDLTYDELRCMPKLAVRCILICPGFFEDEAGWAGASLSHVLDLAGVQPGAMGLELVSADGYSTTIPMSSARAENNLLAYEWEGEPLPILHGFPVRAVLPALSGGYWAKWLVGIQVY